MGEESVGIRVIFGNTYVFDCELPPGDVRQLCYDDNVHVLVSAGSAAFALQDEDSSGGVRRATERRNRVLVHAWAALYGCGLATSDIPPEPAAGLLENLFN